MINNKLITWSAAQFHEDCKDIRRAFNQRSPTTVTHLKSWYGSSLDMDPEAMGHIYPTLKLYHSTFGNAGTNTTAELFWNSSEEPEKFVGATVASLTCRWFRPLRYWWPAEHPLWKTATDLKTSEQDCSFCMRCSKRFAEGMDQTLTQPRVALAAHLLISPSHLLAFKKLQWCT